MRKTQVFEEYTKSHWEDVYSAVKLPVCSEPRAYPDEHRLYSEYLKVRGLSLFEVGCAPGRWLAYFARHFGMQVSGIEYVERAAELTRINLQMQGFSGNIVCGDFFKVELPESEYDIVDSRGFIEHFPSTQPVIDRIVRLARKPGGYVLTIVPNFLGVNGWVRRIEAPRSYSGHLHLTREQLLALHENAGLRTVFCDYVGVPAILRDTPEEYRKQSGVERQAFRLLRFLFNSSFKCGHRWFGLRVPRSRVLSPRILYIGQR